MCPVITRIDPTSEIHKTRNETWSKVLKPEWIEVGESKVQLPVFYEKIAERVENFEVREDDVFVATHPRSGTTWALEMCWLIANDCDFERAKESILTRVHYIDNRVYYPDELWEEFKRNNPLVDVLEMAPKLEIQRIFKTHLPFDLLPRQIRDSDVKPKIIYISRNPKDVCLSFYHLSKSMHDFLGTFDEFCEQFLAGKTYYGPYWHHILSYWNERQRFNLLIISYEEMKRNLPAALEKVASFLGKKLTEDQINDLSNHLSFEKLSKNSSVNHEELTSKFRQFQVKDAPCEKFMRKGIVGGHKDEMSPEMIERFDKWIEENTRGTDFQLL